MKTEVIGERKKNRQQALALITGMLMIIATLLAGDISFAAEKQVKVTIDTKLVVFNDAKPYIDSNQRTLVPIAFIAQGLGANVAWDEENFKVTIDKGEDTIVLKIGSNKVDVNGAIQTIDTAAALKDSRTFVPLAFISQCLGADVKWEASTWTVIITTAGNIPPVVEVPEGTVDLTDYYTSDPLAFGTTAEEKAKKYSIKEVAKEDMPYEFTLRPMKNTYNIPNYTVDMGLCVDLKENAPVTIDVIDVEGRLYGLTKVGNKIYSTDFFISKEVESVIIYNGETKEAYITKLSPTFKTGFSGTGEKDQTGRGDIDPDFMRELIATGK